MSCGNTESHARLKKKKTDRQARRQAGKHRDEKWDKVLVTAHRPWAGSSKRARRKKRRLRLLCCNEYMQYVSASRHSLPYGGRYFYKYTVSKMDFWVRVVSVSFANRRWPPQGCGVRFCKTGRGDEERRLVLRRVFFFGVYFFTILKK